ncbi:MAG: hypothetical protein J5590_07800 [Clostridia bacterium]|nr:hypothetical protein [Clostridia bacterium]
MKKVYEKTLSIVFSVFIILTMILSFAFGKNGMIETLVENKDAIMAYEPTEKYIKNTVSIAGKAFENGVFLKTEYVDLYGGIQKAFGKKVIWEADTSKTIMLGSDNKLYSSGNVSLNFKESEVNKDKLCGYGENIKSFAKYLNEKGCDLVVFLAPSRYDPDKVSLPCEISDNSKENVDYLYETIKDGESLTALNAQKLYAERSMDFGDMFYKTDHHWTVKTAFWAYAEICEALDSNCGYNIDSRYYDLNSFNVETLKGKYLGSYGARVGGLFVGYDDFDLIYPKFETDYTKSVCKNQNKRMETGGKIETSGSFTEAVFTDFDGIKSGKTKLTFGSYIAADRSEVRLVNRKSATDKKILIIKDSYALPTSAFLSTCFAETRLIDLRYLKDMSACEYIDNYNPDLVLILYNPGVYDDMFFDFGEEGR